MEDFNTLSDIWVCLFRSNSLLGPSIVRGFSPSVLDSRHELSLAATLFGQSYVGFPPWFILSRDVVQFKRRRTSDLNGNDPHIRRLAAIVGFQRQRSSDSNSSGKPRIRIAVNLGFKRRGDPRIRIAMRTLVLNGDEPPIQTALGNGYEWWRTSVSNNNDPLGLGDNPDLLHNSKTEQSKGSFCFRILRVFNRWRMGQDLVGCGRWQLNRLGG